MRSWKLRRILKRELNKLLSVVIDLFRFGCLHLTQCYCDSPHTHRTTHKSTSACERVCFLHVSVEVCMWRVLLSDRHHPEGNSNKSATWILVQRQGVCGWVIKLLRKREHGIRRAPPMARRSQSQRTSSQGVEIRASRDKRQRRVDLHFIYRCGGRQTVSQESRGCDSALTQQFKLRVEREYETVQQRWGNQTSGILNIT